jgi:hypothetical protein
MTLNNIRIDGSDEFRRLEMSRDQLGCLACASCGQPLEHGYADAMLYRIGTIAGGGGEVVVCRRCRPGFTKVQLPQ